MTKSDAERILGVGPQATPAEIKSAYRKRCTEWHPDKHANDPLAEIGFRLAKEASDFLLNGPGEAPESQKTGGGIPPWFMDLLGKVADESNSEELSGIVGDPDIARSVQHGLRAFLRAILRGKPKN